MFLLLKLTIMNVNSNCIHVSPDYTQKNLNIFMKEDKELEGRFFSHL